MTDPALLSEFERRFRADPDPWSFETSDYERRKREATLAACGPETGRRVLELGAGNGVLASGLAPLARELVAVEAVSAAARLAADRLGEVPAARVVEGLIPADVPPGPFDLVVASEILYYLDASSYAATLAALPGWLAPGGRLVAVHWRPTSGERPRSAEAVHADLAASCGLALCGEHHDSDYLLSVYAATAP